jgi:DNA-binding NarL/FixJ family response regulator
MDLIRLIIVDDHRLFRNGLKALLKESGMNFEISEASNGLEFLEYIKLYPVDIALMDINMPVLNGIEATREATRLFPAIKIIALSMLNEEDYYFQMVEAGAKGFILKDAGSEELTEAIEQVLQNRNFYSQDLLRNVILSLRSNVIPADKQIQENSQFTERELEVLKEIGKGLSNYEIAEKLFISPRTVERHRASLFQKTNSKNSVNLVMYAIKNNLLKV